MNQYFSVYRLNSTCNTIRYEGLPDADLNIVKNDHDDKQTAILVVY